MSFFSDFFKKNETSVVGVDIGSSAIKVVQITKKNSQAVLETYGELALGPYGGGTVGQAVQLSPDQIARGVRDLMHEKEVNVTTEMAGVSIPFASSLMATIEMPDVGKKQLDLMVPMEARKYIPVPINEVMLDWSVIPRDEVKPEIPTLAEEQAGIHKAAETPSKVDVLVVAIHNETIARYQDITAKAGLQAGFYEIEIFSTMRSVLDNTLAPQMIMDIGAASTKLYIVERGIVKSSHTINRGSQDITLTIAKSLGIPMDRAEVMKRQVGASGEDKVLTDTISLVLEYIFAEANRTLLSFEEKYNKTVSKVIMVGGGSALKGLSELAKNAFKTEVIAGDPFSKLAAPAFLENVLKETGPEFAVAIGLALRRLQDLE